jgi:D-sedoheptulose 7-phosphate isomerase
MNKKKFFQNYFNKISTNLNLVDHKLLFKSVDLVKSTKKNNNKIIIVGNGGSAAMASHVAVDLTKVGGIRAINFNEADLITCFANDYGYENWVLKALNFYADENDLVILISSSGKSKNIINAARYAKKNKIKVITFSGFAKSNPLKKIGHINFWVNSDKYNFIEMVHHIWLLAIVDNIAKIKI